MQVTAMPRPNAVLYMASEMPSDSCAWRCAAESRGSATALNVMMRPVTVPISPISVAMFASDQSDPMRFSTAGRSSPIFSLIAASISSGPLLACVSPARTSWSVG